MSLTRDALDAGLRSQVLARASAAYQRFESQWDGEGYRFPVGEATTYDGLPMRWNQQFTMADLAIRLSAHTGGAGYRERVETIFDAFIADLGNDSAWFYWPRRFYDGWQFGEILSGNTPGYAAWDPVWDDWRAEDVWHAATTAQGLAKAAAFLCRAVPLDLGAIADGLEIAPYSSAIACSGPPRRPIATCRVWSRANPWPPTSARSSLACGRNSTIRAISRPSQLWSPRSLRQAH